MIVKGKTYDIGLLVKGWNNDREVSNSEYRRQPVKFEIFAPNRLANIDRIVFPTAKTSWGYVVGFAIFDDGREIVRDYTGNSFVIGAEITAYFESQSIVIELVEFPEGD